MKQVLPLPTEGNPAPDFSGPTQDGTTISLKDYQGKRLAIYFYPRDNTPVCTVQACNLRDNFDVLEKAGIAIVGVSDDPVEKHRGFANKHTLNFPLIADTDHQMMKAYGTYGEKTLFGRKFMGTKRMTFLIDENGLLKKVISKPKSSKHAQEILKGFGL